jgi:shikimate kinase
VGYRGTGKSTVARVVAARLGRPCVDADAELEGRLGRSIRSVFEEFGEPFFRDREEALLAELTAAPGCVIATGGGVVLRPSNRAALRRYGSVVWLTADPAVLAERLRRNPSEAAGRPALTASGTIEEIAEVLRARTPLYREVADVEVPTDGRTADEVAREVLAVLDRGTKKGPGSGE